MSLFAPTFNTLRDLYINELRDLYSAETQLIDALPKMAEAARYEAVKRESARLHPEDRLAYMAAKEGILLELERRAAHARFLLESTDLPIWRVAERVGMPDAQQLRGIVGKR